MKEAFNAEAQMEFVLEQVQCRKHTLLIITDMETCYTEAGIVENMCLATVVNFFEKMWIYHHGVAISNVCWRQIQ